MAEKLSNKRYAKMKAKDTNFGVAYARTSSLGKKVKGSRNRQIQEAVEAAGSQGINIHTSIAEVISGCLSYEKRETLKNILERKLPDMPKDKAKTVHLFVESVRALARNSMVAEQVYQESRKNNVRIVPKDYPALFAHNQTPTENFVRKMVCALQELDRDTVVWRLQQGQEHKRQTTAEKTQAGQPKVNGCKSYVEHLAPSEAVKKTIMKLGKKRDAGEFGWRPLGHKIAALLKLDKPLPHETAKRVYKEILMKASKKWMGVRTKVMCFWDSSLCACTVTLNCPALAKRAEAGVARLKKGSAPNSWKATHQLHTCGDSGSKWDRLPTPAASVLCD